MKKKRSLKHETTENFNKIFLCFAKNDMKKNIHDKISATNDEKQKTTGNKKNLAYNQQQQQKSHEEIEKN
jgi:hypothetical protein